MRSLLTLAAVAAAVMTPASVAVAAPEPGASFSCDGPVFGFYTDPENPSIFHHCMPVEYPDGTEVSYKQSFICPYGDPFDQEAPSA